MIAVRYFMAIWIIVLAPHLAMGLLLELPGSALVMIALLLCAASRRGRPTLSEDLGRASERRDVEKGVYV
ncbi:hypothetical protein BS329_19200 [Amycolatopsis coloradensis]|uniref:Uncharacterized protein n=1 Tax=Amycolatopsis coloradensis TaxID=76021 RepID=A0A1R0KRS9_9PSEU|nr:hypothetical protein BS329_19200 [Amycolatopsis coloradensis]